MTALPCGRHLVERLLKHVLLRREAAHLCHQLVEARDRGLDLDEAREGERRLGS